MSVVAPELPGARVLDLFAGSGALGLEALSRGAEHATFVENAPSALRVLQSNLAALGASDRSTVVRTDALRYVRGLDALSFDLAFADPPYAKGMAAALVEAFLERPFAALLCVEHRRTDPLPDAPAAREKRYGDTQLTFIPAPS
jgi:16S rRNA (guanine966-N2)-methyltransferase